MATGKVKWFNHAKGYGFIIPEEGEDLFIHVTNVDHADAKRITDGDAVEFEIRPGRKGQEAYNVRVVRQE
jgi:CspA family cold shock protein